MKQFIGPTDKKGAVLERYEYLAAGQKVAGSNPNWVNTACVQGSTNGTNGIQISFKVLPMVPLVIPLVPMVMPVVPLALPMVPLVSQWYHWLPMATNGTVGKITNGTIGRTPNRATIKLSLFIQ